MMDWHRVGCRDEKHVHIYIYMYVYIYMYTCIYIHGAYQSPYSTSMLCGFTETLQYYSMMLPVTQSAVLQAGVYLALINRPEPVDEVRWDGAPLS